MKISVDHARQYKERNLAWVDYPVMNSETGRKLKFNLGHYFSTWEEYCKERNDTNFDTKKRKEDQV